MLYKDVIGEEVINKRGELGTIDSYEEDYVFIKFVGREELSKFDKVALKNGLLVFTDINIQENVDELTDVEDDDEMAKLIDKYFKKKGIKTTRTFNLDEMVDAEYHVEFLRKDVVKTYQEIENEYGINISKFGRGINTPKNSDKIILISALKLLSSDNRFTYHDHFTCDGDFIYSGEGKYGNQTLTRGNKAICDAKLDGKKILLFVRLAKDTYYYQGEYEFVEYNIEKSTDAKNTLRDEYKFKLHKISN